MLEYQTQIVWKASILKLNDNVSSNKEQSLLIRQTFCFLYIHISPLFIPTQRKMESSYKKIAIVSVVLVILGGATAQTLCNMTVIGLLECKPAVTPPKPKPPTADCCSALAQADFKCLCSYKDNKILPRLGIDPELAQQLPVKCKIPNPPKCQRFIYI